MHDFMHEWNSTLQKKIVRMIENKKPTDEIIAALDRCPKKSIDGWDHHRMCELDEKMQDWFVELPFPVKTNYRWMYPGDGPLEKKLRKFARDQEDRQEFSNRLHMQDETNDEDRASNGE